MISRMIIQKIRPKAKECRKQLFAATFVFSAVFINSFAFAADDNALDGKSGGLPQLNTDTYLSQVFWLFITFTILYVAFSKAVLPLISSTIQKRHLHIEDDRETAEKLAQEAEDAQRSYEQKISEARDEASQIHKDIEADIQSRTLKKWEEFRKNAAIEEAKVLEEISRSKQEAMEEMNTIAAEVAQVAAEKIVGISLDITDAKNAVDSLNKKGKAA